jgi:hypothetical protein
MVRTKSAGIQEDLTLEGVRLLAVQVDKKKRIGTAGLYILAANTYSSNSHYEKLHFPCKTLICSLG